MLESTRQSLRDSLWLYKEDKKMLATYREALLYPYKEFDDNIGGGRTNLMASPTESIALKLVEPKTPVALEEIRRTVSVIDFLLDACKKEDGSELSNALNKDHYDVIKSKYIDGYRGKKNSIVSYEICLSESTVKRRDKEFLKIMALALGKR